MHSLCKPRIDSIESLVEAPASLVTLMDLQRETGSLVSRKSNWTEMGIALYNLTISSGLKIQSYIICLMRGLCNDKLPPS